MSYPLFLLLFLVMPIALLGLFLRAKCIQETVHLAAQNIRANQWRQ